MLPGAHCMHYKPALHEFYYSPVLSRKLSPHRSCCLGGATDRGADKAGEREAQLGVAAIAAAGVGRAASSS